MADEVPGISPYQFGFNNPIAFQDPSGLIPLGSPGPGASPNLGALSAAPLGLVLQIGFQIAFNIFGSYMPAQVSGGLQVANMAGQAAATPPQDDWYLNLAEGKVEYHAGSENLLSEGLMHMGGDNMTMGQQQDWLKKRGLQSYLYEGERIIDTRKLYKGWQMAQIFSKDNVETILGINLLSNFGGKAINRSFNPKFRSNSTKATNGANNIDQIISKVLRTQKQVDEHIIGGSRLGTNSYLNNIDDAKSILNAVHNGKARILSTNAAQNRVYIEYKNITGYYNNNGIKVPTNKFLIKGGKSSTVVPIHPNSTTFK